MVFDLQKVSLGEAPSRIAHHDTGRMFCVITTSCRVVQNRYVQRRQARQDLPDIVVECAVHTWYIKPWIEPWIGIRCRTIFSVLLLTLLLRSRQRNSGNITPMFVGVMRQGVLYSVSVFYLFFSDEEEEHNFVKFLDDTNFEELYCHPLDAFEVRQRDVAMFAISYLMSGLVFSV